MKLKLTIIGLSVLCLPLIAQALSLKQCIEYAKHNSSNIKIALLEFEVSGRKISERIGTTLPQIDVSGSLENNLKLTTQLMPGELLGKPGTTVAVEMGTKYDANGGIELTQKIIDPSFWVGLKAAKISKLQAQKNMQKTEEETYYDVSEAYYKALIIQKQLNNLKVVLAVSEQSLKSTELKYENGLVKKIDVDKIKVSYNSTNSQMQQTELNYKQFLNNLKYVMGMPADSTMVLSDSLFEIEPTDSESSYSNEKYLENRIDYQLQKINLSLQTVDKTNNIAAYLPTLSLYANYNYQAMRSEFDFLKSGKQWYRNSAVGLQLKIPIFSGFQRLSKVSQSQLNIEKAKENIKLKEQSIKVEISNYEIQYRTALDNIENEKENLALAESVYRSTQQEFKQGTSSSLDLVQAESSFRETQNNYYNKLLNLYTAKLDLEKSKGTLVSFINNLK
ncbi:MAG: TolC family protein [Candidatus Zixiibacteriota bacterium]